MSLQQNKKVQVVGIDYPCLDYVIEVDHIPETNGEADIDNESWQGGGMVPTALAALGRLGVSGGLIGISGDDVYGEFCKADLEKHGVDTSHIIMDLGTRTDFCISVAEKSTQGRSFITRWGNCRRMTVQDLDPEYIGQADYLHLCMEMNEINVKAAKIARDYGVKVVIDADHYSEKTEENLSLIDVFIASEKYYCKKFPEGKPEENLKKVMAQGPEIVVFTLGEKGCIGISKDGFFKLEAFRLEKVVDTTGAGDVFHGAFIKALLDGKTPEECARFASAVSSIKCMRLGGRAGIPDLETTLHFLKTGQVGESDFDTREKRYQQGLAILMNKN